MLLIYCPRLKAPQWVKSWPLLMVWTYVKSISHMTIPKIWNFLSNYPCLMRNFLVCRKRMRKFMYFIKNDILYRPIIDNGHKFDTAVVPEDLTSTVLHLGHNQSGHNDYQRTYAAIKHVYY